MYPFRIFPMQHKRRISLEIQGLKVKKQPGKDRVKILSDQCMPLIFVSIFSVDSIGYLYYMMGKSSEDFHMSDYV